jgi:multidrug efflux pump subunit AcrB
MAAKDPRLMAVRPNGLDDMPRAHFVVDRERPRRRASIADINSTLQGLFGQLYVNQFTRSGRTKRVFIQGEPDSRMEPDDLTKWYLRNNQGQMVPLGRRTSTGRSARRSSNATTASRLSKSWAGVCRVSAPGRPWRS